jgi:hypothetical protein
MSEPSPDLAVLEGLEIVLRNALAALQGPATEVIARRPRPGPGCVVSETSLLALAIHVDQIIAAVAELRGQFEQRTIPSIRQRRRPR